MITRRQSTSISQLKITFGLGIIAMILMIFNVVMSARVAQDGLVVDELQKQAAQLKTQIALLEQQLLNSTSLQELSAKADELGYQPPHQVITINGNHRIAQF